MNREEIVCNGCSGGCCAKFILPVMMEDLLKMKAIYDNDDPTETITCVNGYERHCLPLDELDKLLEMLIYLGLSAYDPQTGETFNNRLQYDSSMFSLEEIHEHTHGHYLIRNEQVLGMTYTCKHFDTENKICTNYENRPHLCRNYGNGCKYKGCTYDAVLQNQSFEQKEQNVCNELVQTDL